MNHKNTKFQIALNAIETCDTKGTHCEFDLQNVPRESGISENERLKIKRDKFRVGRHKETLSSDKTAPQ